MSSSVKLVLDKARALEGLRVVDLARRVGTDTPRGGLHGKGRLGEFIERALGATGGSGRRIVDFPEIGLELKTIPVGPDGSPQESTFVCGVDLAEDVDWDQSWAFQKLRRVLFLPLIGERRCAAGSRVLGQCVLFEPTAEEDATLRSDYDEVMGLVGIGRIEEVTAHLGTYLQLRPKAKDGHARTVSHGPDGEAIPTVPRGFYLRTQFTAHVLRSRCR